MKPPRDDIAAPPFPKEAEWINVASLRMDQQIGSPVLVEFWDCCRVNSLRTLPYIQAWHRRYAEAGLGVIGIHSAGFPPSEDAAVVRTAVERLEIEYPVVIDTALRIWNLYGNRGWPARYLWNQQGLLHYYHYGEGAYAETEEEIQALLDVSQEIMKPLRPEDAANVLLPAITTDQPGPYDGPYEAAGVWGVFDGSGTVQANDSAIEIAHPGCYPLIEHERHTVGELQLTVPDGVTCYAICCTAGIA